MDAHGSWSEPISPAQHRDTTPSPCHGFESRTRYHLFQLELSRFVAAGLCAGRIPEEQAGYGGSKGLSVVNEAFGEQDLLHALAVLEGELTPHAVGVKHHILMLGEFEHRLDSEVGIWFSEQQGYGA